MNLSFFKYLNEFQNWLIGFLNIYVLIYVILLNIKNIYIL